MKLKETLEPNDLIYNIDDDGNIESGGYYVNSLLLKNNCSPFITSKTSISSEDLVIPCGLFWMNNIVKNKDNKCVINQKDEDTCPSCIDDSLYDKLLKILKEDKTEGSKKNKQTRKNKVKCRMTRKK
jgi:hypothetical protein